MLERVTARPSEGPIVTALLGGTPFGREGLRHFLAGTRYRLADDAAAEEPVQLYLVLTDPASGERHLTRQSLLDLKGSTDTRIVILADLTESDLLEAMAAGANGVLSVRCELASLLALLGRVVEGDLVYAARPIVELIRTAVPQPALSSARTAGLTRRERAIADLLVKGASNKLIARHCGVSENTIKIQVRGLLLKLGVATRTQAALTLLDKGPQKTSKRS